MTKTYAVISERTGHTLISNATFKQVRRFINRKGYAVISEYTGEVIERKKPNYALIIVNVIACLFLAWIVLSTVDVVATNTEPNATQAEWNFYALITEHDERTIDGTVVATDTVLTTDGNVWTLDTDGIAVGEQVRVRFTTQGTDDVKDDKCVWLKH